jgi:hypothetical protein
MLKIRVVSSRSICRELIGTKLKAFGCILEEKSRFSFFIVAEGPALNWQVNRSVWLSAIAYSQENFFEEVRELKGISLNRWCENRYSGGLGIWSID